MWKLFCTKKHLDLLGGFLKELYSSDHRITGKNIEKFSRGGIYKPSIQAEIFQNSQKVEFINQTLQAKMLEISEKTDFINHQYRQKKYCKIMKRWNL